MESSLMMELMKYGIIIVGFLLTYAELRVVIKKKCSGYMWVKVCIGLMGLYWSGYYINSVFGSPLNAHQIWVRGPLLLTLSLFTAGAIMSLRRSQR